MLPPRNYTLVHEDGRLHKRDNFTPMSFGMQRIHNNAAPEPVWVQTQNARWMQGTTEVVVIAHTRGASGMAGATSYSSSPQTICDAHTRSELPVGATASYSAG